MATVLVLGGGGREHALVVGLHRSSKVKKVIAVPGNAGIAQEPGVQCYSDVSPTDDVSVWYKTKFCSLQFLF